ncbi:MAG: DNA double-strand break repair nuclease NurA [Nanoarchaeota archaeon]|nr:DNA double-strand break repair nuclease NurA [Nanoarchaeota archaeon]
MHPDLLKAAGDLAAHKDTRPPVFRAEEYAKASLYSEENFSDIEPKEGRILFIDGGSQPLIETPAFTIAQIRVYYAVFDYGKKLQRKVFEAHAILGEECQLFPDELKLKGKLDIDQCRRLAELLTAEKACSLLSEGDVLCIDGSLHPKDDHRQLKALAEACADKGVLLAGLSKTSDMVTADNRPVAEALSPLACRKSWAYSPCQEFTLGPSQMTTGFARFHARARHVFRFDTTSIDAVHVIASHCRDPSFLGYPYGLMDADKFARISHREAEQQRLLLQLRLPKLRELSKDAHQVLDSVNTTKKFI